MEALFDSRAAFYDHVGRAFVVRGRGRWGQTGGRQGKGGASQGDSHGEAREHMTHGYLQIE